MVQMADLPAPAYVTVRAIKLRLKEISVDTVHRKQRRPWCDKVVAN